MLRFRWRRVLAVIGWCAVIAAPFVAHAAISTGRFLGIAIVLGVAQAIGLCVFAMRRLDGWQRALGVALAVALLACVGAMGIGWVMVTSGVSHAILYVSLLLLFGQSLRSGRTPLVTGLAMRFRGALNPRMRAYTRTVTKAWCLFFAGQLLLSAGLLALASHPVWSLFINVLDGPMVVAMFAAEYGIRRWCLRQETHQSPLATALHFTRARLDS
jgi:uncharacterized membrane protein